MDFMPYWRKPDTARPENTRDAKIIKVIATKSLVGLGTKDDVCREVITYWSLDGEKLFVQDPTESEYQRYDPFRDKAQAGC